MTHRIEIAYSVIGSNVHYATFIDINIPYCFQAFSHYLTFVSEFIGIIYVDKYGSGFGPDIDIAIDVLTYTFGGIIREIQIR